MQHNLANYLPVRITGEKQNPVLRWVDMEGISSSESFFDNFWINQIDSLSDKTIETGIESFGLKYQQSRCLQPNGFIFHMSRCGSTLLANMLRRIKGTLAFSEPSALDPVFTVLSGEDLEKMIRFYSSVNDGESNYVLKFPNYATIAAPFINKSFPETPKVFLYRDPVEVIISNLQDPKQEWIYSHEVTGLTNEQMYIKNSVVKNIVMGLKRICEMFYDNMDEQSFCLNYTQLADPGKVEKTLREVLKRFNFRHNASDIENALEEMNYYSKDPFKLFSEVQKERQPVPDEILELADQHLMPVYRKLEQKRLAV